VGVEYREPHALRVYDLRDGFTLSILPNTLQDRSRSTLDNVCLLSDALMQDSNAQTVG